MRKKPETDFSALSFPNNLFIQVVHSPTVSVPSRNNFPKYTHDLLATILPNTQFVKQNSPRPLDKHTHLAKRGKRLE